jgi:hypothetical protein
MGAFEQMQAWIKVQRWICRYCFYKQDFWIAGASFLTWSSKHKITNFNHERRTQENNGNPEVFFCANGL